MGTRTVWPPKGWRRASFPHGDHEHDFYVVGPSSGEPSPSILLMHELPGLDDSIAHFADRLARHFRVVLPSILGRDGDPTLCSTLRQLCVRREVHLLARDGVSRSVEWLRDFVDAEVAGDGQPYGVVGLCFLGNFALALAKDPRVRAAVVGEPAAGPYPWGLGLDRADREALRSDTPDLRVRCYRYSHDLISPRGKLRNAQKLLGDRMTAMELRSCNPVRHSTLTKDSADEGAIDEVTGFLLERLA